MQSPDHYKGTQLLDALVAGDVGFCEGNICKYVYRWKNKDGLKDLYKARDYLNTLIANEERKVTAQQLLDLQPSIFAIQNQTSKG